LPRQDEERYLENVLCVVLVPKCTAAHAPDQSGVAPQQSLECLVVTISDEALKELGVGLLAIGARHTR
jgi:hypothetical protein